MDDSSAVQMVAALVAVFVMAVVVGLVGVGVVFAVWKIASQLPW